MKIAASYRAGQGAASIRTQPLADHLGWPLSTTQTLAEDIWDVLWIAKRYRASVRARCDLLIYDPCDCWRWPLDYGQDPGDFWKSKWKELRFDVLIATSPACQAVMQAALPSIPVHLLPHAADARVRPAYHAQGPIVYFGQPAYVHAAPFKEACRKIGRKFASGFLPHESGLRPSLILHPRLPPTNIPLNRYCKPQIKLENAAAMGCPVLATDDPCVTSLRPEVVTAPADHFTDAGKLVEALSRGLAGPPLANPVTVEQFAAAALRVVQAHTSHAPAQ